MGETSQAITSFKKWWLKYWNNIKDVNHKNIAKNKVAYCLMVLYKFGLWRLDYISHSFPPIVERWVLDREILGGSKILSGVDFVKIRLAWMWFKSPIYCIGLIVGMLDPCSRSSTERCCFAGSTSTTDLTRRILQVSRRILGERMNLFQWINWLAVSYKWVGGFWGNGWTFFCRQLVCVDTCKVALLEFEFSPLLTDCIFQASGMIFGVTPTCNAKQITF